ncbi:Protein KAKU4 [Bienertia sinuspersici]
MATTYSRRNSGVGGKILKNNNRKFLRVNPYSRPSTSSPPSQDPENPNWFSGLIYPAKVIANGAGKILSFFGSDYSSSSDADSSENEEDDDEEIENEMSCQEDDQPDKVPDADLQKNGLGLTMLLQCTALEANLRANIVNLILKVLSPSNKSDSKRAIEQMVIQESYTRKEANELIKLVRSRIVDTNGTFGQTTPNVRTTAIMEARKWLQDKRSGSKKFDNERDFSNVASPSHVESRHLACAYRVSRAHASVAWFETIKISRNEKGSPVDMARSYMQNRPAWASPTLKQAEAGSSSPLGMLHFKDETPKSTLRSSELKRGSFASGSWNLLEEIRRVRTKASEELLASAPLSKTILSSFSPESNAPQDPVSNKGDPERAGPAESTHDRPDNVLPYAAASTPSRASQDDDTVRSVEHQGSPEAAGLTNNAVEQLKCTTAEMVLGALHLGDLDQGQDKTHEARPLEEGNGNLFDASHGERDIHTEENSNPREEPAIDIPTDNVINGSQNSSSMKHELPQDISQPVIEDGPAVKVKATQERKSRGYNTRKGKGSSK